MLSDQNLQCTNTHRKEQKKASNCVVNYVFFIIVNVHSKIKNLWGGSGEVWGGGEDSPLPPCR